MQARIRIAACLFAVVLAVSLFACSKKPTQPSPSGSLEIQGGALYQQRGVSVYRIAGNPEALAVRTIAITVTDPSGAERSLDFAAAKQELSDDQAITVLSSWRTIAADRFRSDPSSVLTLDETSGPIKSVGVFGGGLPPDPCPCATCTSCGTGCCKCSWGCIKVIYTS